METLLIIVGVLLFLWFANTLIWALMAPVRGWLSGTRHPTATVAMDRQSTSCSGAPIDTSTGWRPGQLATRHDPSFAQRMADLDQQITSRGH